MPLAPDHYHSLSLALVARNITGQGEMSHQKIFKHNKRRIYIIRDLKTAKLVLDLKDRIVYDQEHNQAIILSPAAFPLASYF
jgi:hypothetical protein